MNIREIENKFELISKAKGSLEKKALLKGFSEDKDFVKVLEFIYNPYKRTGIADKKLSRKIKCENVLDIRSLGELIDYLVKNNTGSDTNVAVAQTFIENNKEHEDFLKSVITKTYSSGINVTTINKVIPGLIPTFGVMLATKIEDVKDLEGNLVIGTKKLDGFRYTFIKKDGVGYNRSGIPLEGVVEIEEEFKNLPDGVYDGELLAIGDFKEAKDEYKATSKIARKKGEKRGLKFVCFDYIENYEDFYKGKCETWCINRKNKLKAIIEEHKPKFIEYAEVLYYDYYDAKKVGDLASELTKAGEEGLMLNIANAPYECKRTKTLIKIKEFYTCDLRVIGYTEGSGNFEGTLGALVVDYKGNKLNVGSGFSLEQRITLWNKKEELIGKIIEVGYREETSNADGGLSLRFPTFKTIREDKNDVSYN